MRSPRPTLISATGADFFDIQGVWDNYRQAKRIYGRLGFPERVPSRVLVGWYPSELRIASPGTSFDHTIHVTIGRVEDLGSETRAYFGLGRHPGVGFAVTLAADAGLEAGARVELTWVEASLRLFDSATGEAIPM